LFPLLPSPLDRLDSKQVPDADKLATGGGLVGVIGDPRLRHWGKVRSVAWSPDGQLVVTSGGDQTIRIWNATTGTQQTVIPLGYVTNWAGFSRDGARVMSHDPWNALKQWDPAGKSLPSPPGRMASYSGEFLATTNQGNPPVKIWQLSTG